MNDYLLRAETIAGGALLEALDFALEEALANVLDPNTPAKKKRKVVLEIVVDPDANRKSGALTFQVKTGLAAPVPVETSILLDRDRSTGKAVASELRSDEHPNHHRLPTGGKAVQFQAQ